jgi:hypothetical protein
MSALFLDMGKNSAFCILKESFAASTARKGMKGTGNHPPIHAFTSPYYHI